MSENKSTAVRFNQQEFAAKLGLCRKTIYVYVNKGLMTPKRTPGGGCFFTQEDVDAYLEAEAESTTSPRLSQLEFAELVGLNRHTIYTYIKKGAIVPRKSFSGVCYFTQEDVDTFLRGEKIEW